MNRQSKILEERRRTSRVYPPAIASAITKYLYQINKRLITKKKKNNKNIRKWEVQTYLNTGSLLYLAVNVKFNT